MHITGNAPQALSELSCTQIAPAPVLGRTLHGAPHPAPRGRQEPGRTSRRTIATRLRESPYWPRFYLRGTRGLHVRPRGHQNRRESKRAQPLRSGRPRGVKPVSLGGFRPSAIYLQRYAQGREASSQLKTGFPDACDDSALQVGIAGPATDTGAPHMGRLTHHNAPGPVGRPRRDSVGHAFIASVGAGGMGQGHETCSSRRSNATRSGPAPRCTLDSPNPGTRTC